MGFTGGWNVWFIINGQPGGLLCHSITMATAARFVFSCSTHAIPTVLLSLGSDNSSALTNEQLAYVSLYKSTYNHNQHNRWLIEWRVTEMSKSRADYHCFLLFLYYLLLLIQCVAAGVSIKQLGGKKHCSLFRFFFLFQTPALVALRCVGCRKFKKSMPWKMFEFSRH